MQFADLAPTIKNKWIQLQYNTHFKSFCCCCFENEIENKYINNNNNSKPMVTIANIFEAK